MSDIDSVTGDGLFSMVPTQSGFANFVCWNESERSALIEDMGYTADMMSVFPSIHFKTDDYTFESLAFALFFDKVMGMKVELFDFYHGASNLIAQETKIPIFHFEVLKQDFEQMPSVETSYAGVSQIRWLIESGIVEQIESEFDDDECPFNLDEWQTFANPRAVSLMSPAHEIVISPNEDGQFACDESQGCMHGDSTWYPPQCDFPGNECTALLQFLPEHDLMNRRIIIENNLLLVIKYMGPTMSANGRENFKTFHKGDFRVIFQMRSIDLQSHDAFGWTQIGLAPDDDINIGQDILRLKPAWLKYTIQHLEAFHVYLDLWFGAFDVAQVTNKFINAVQWGTDDTRDLRMQLVCDRLKERSPLFEYFTQEIGKMTVTLANCEGGLTDESLEFVADKTDQELLFGPVKNEAYFTQVDGITEGWRAIYVKKHCIQEHDDVRHGGLYTFGYILSGFAVVFLLGSALCTIVWKKEKIIRASSVKMLCIIFLGSAINLCYILFPRYDRLSDCYLRRYVLVFGISLMFAALEAKTRRLHVIQQSIKQLKRVKITDKDLILRVSGMTLFAVLYLTVLVLVWPIEIRQRVISSERMLVCKWNDTAETLYKVLFALIVVALFMIGRESWSLRTTNKLYNEYVYISRNISTP